MKHNLQALFNTVLIARVYVPGTTKKFIGGIASRRQYSDCMDWIIDRV